MIQGSSGPPSGGESPAVSPRDIKFLGFNFTPFGSPKNTEQIPNGAGNKSAAMIEKLKSPQRSRSLIRRSSRKAKQQMNNVHNPDDCVVS